MTAMIVLPLLGFGKLEARSKSALGQSDVGTSAAVVPGTVTEVYQHHIFSLIWRHWYERWSWRVTYDYRVGNKTYTQCDSLHTKSVFKAPLAVKDDIKVIYSLSRPQIARIFSSELKDGRQRIVGSAGTCQNI